VAPTAKMRFMVSFRSGRPSDEADAALHGQDLEDEAGRAGRLPDLGRLLLQELLEPLVLEPGDILSQGATGVAEALEDRHQVDSSLPAYGARGLRVALRRRRLLREAGWAARGELSLLPLQEPFLPQLRQGRERP